MQVSGFPSSPDSTRRQHGEGSASPQHDVRKGQEKKVQIAKVFGIPTIRQKLSSKSHQGAMTVRVSREASQKCPENVHPSARAWDFLADRRTSSSCRQLGPPQGLSYNNVD